ncbi:unnamed protein product, partial [Rotaria socialis]
MHTFDGNSFSNLNLKVCISFGHDDISFVGIDWLQRGVKDV